MLEFLFGYVLGSSDQNSTALSGKSFVTTLLILMALSGIAWLMLPVMFPESVPVSIDQCRGGTLFSAAFCSAIGLASTVGLILFWLVAVVAVVAFVLLSPIGSVANARTHDD